MNTKCKTLFFVSLLLRVCIVCPALYQSLTVQLLGWLSLSMLQLGAGGKAAQEGLRVAGRFVKWFQTHLIRKFLHPRRSGKGGG